MKCDQKMFDLLKQTFGLESYDAKAVLKWTGASQPTLILNGEQRPVDKITWLDLAQTSEMTLECIPCLSDEPLEVIAFKNDNPKNPTYGLVAINRTGQKPEDYCGYNYAPAVVEAMGTQG